jgi:hypothetical protein
MKRVRPRLRIRSNKGLRTYTVDELARLLGCHRNTVRHWIKAGLRLVDGDRPHLIRGIDAMAFLIARKTARKQKCGPGKLFCFKCKRPTQPVLKSLAYKSITAGFGTLTGLCSVCGTRMNRKASRTSLDNDLLFSHANFQQPDPRLVDTAACSLNDDLNGRG